MTTSIRQTHRYTAGEEIASSVTHGIGAGLSLAALAVLVSFSAVAGDARRVVSFAVFGGCLFLLYLASTCYHACRQSRLKRVFRVFDHVAIFLLIAGTYTPVALVGLRGGWGWTLFGLIWGLAAFGILLEVFFLDRFRWLTLAIYLGMGWLVVIAAGPVIEAFPFSALVWLGAGGLCYTGGVIFYLWKSLPYNHAVWHLFVLAGSACHFLAFLLHMV